MAIIPSSSSPTHNSNSRVSNRSHNSREDIQDIIHSNMGSLSKGKGKGRDIHPSRARINSSRHSSRQPSSKRISRTRHPAQIRPQLRSQMRKPRLILPLTSLPTIIAATHWPNHGKSTLILPRDDRITTIPPLAQPNGRDLRHQQRLLRQPLQRRWRRAQTRRLAPQKHLL